MICPVCGQEAQLEGERYLREKWGRSFIDMDGKVRDYTMEELEELERIYRMQSAEYKGYLTPRIEYNLQKIAKLELEQMKNISKGDGQEAKRYADIIATLKRSEGMTAADIRKGESLKLDALADVLEKKGVIKDGKILPKGELVKLLSQERGKYSTSRDVVDAMMLAIINTMRSNNGESELDALPLTAQVKDTMGELQPGMSRVERQAMEDLGLVVPAKEKKHAQNH